MSEFGRHWPVDHDDIIMYRDTVTNLLTPYNAGEIVFQKGDETIEVKHLRNSSFRYPDITETTITTPINTKYSGTGKTFAEKRSYKGMLGEDGGVMDYDFAIVESIPGGPIIDRSIRPPTTFQTEAKFGLHSVSKPEHIVLLNKLRTLSPADRI